MANRFTYSRWDGTQKGFDLDAEGLFDELTDDLLYHGDVNAALRRMMQEGMRDRNGERVQGLRELLDKLRQQRQDKLDQFDLGGGVIVDVVHLAGHTRGHCGFLVDHDGVFFCADVDLTGFGPYYGDHWSNLDDFEDAIARCRTIDARHYVTFHQKGVVDGRAQFVRMLDAFASVIGRREDAMLAFLAEPHSIADMVAHRFVYRPQVELTFADHVERRTAEQHVARFVRRGQVVATDDGRVVAA